MKATDLVKALLEHRDGLLGFIFALTRDREAAEDIFQETGIAVVEESKKGTDVVHFLPWVHEIARRRVAEHFRKNPRRAAALQVGALDEAVSQAFVEHASEPADRGRRREYLDECMEGLTPAQRQLIERRYRDREPLREIADSVSSTEGSVKVLLWRARRQLGRCIEGKFAGGGD